MCIYSSLELACDHSECLIVKTIKNNFDRQKQNVHIFLTDSQNQSTDFFEDQKFISVDNRQNIVKQTKQTKNILLRKRKIINKRKLKNNNPCFHRPNRNTLKKQQIQKTLDFINRNE